MVFLSILRQYLSFKKVLKVSPFRQLALVFILTLIWVCLVCRFICGKVFLIPFRPMIFFCWKVKGLRITSGTTWRAKANIWCYFKFFNVIANLGMSLYNMQVCNTTLVKMVPNMMHDSSNINEVTRSVLNFLVFFMIRFYTRKKAQKEYKALKALKA